MNILRGNFITITLLMMLLAGCKSPEEIQKPYVKIKESPKAQMSYYLPKNVYHIQVKVIREQIFRGPYSAFSEEYLGIDKNVARYDEISYALQSAEINVLSEPDAAEQYFVHMEGNEIIPFNVTKTGVLAGVNREKIQEPANYDIKDVVPEKREYAFLDLSVKPIVDIRDEVSYEYKKVDSALVRVPVESTVTEVKNFQQLAWSAAKFIATLRESRFRLLAGLSEMDQIPERVQARIAKIDEIEARYLELFIGHRDYDTLTYNFFYEPGRHGERDARKPLFFFSTRNGIRKVSGDIVEQDTYSRGVPVVFKLMPRVLPETKEKTAFETIEPKGLIYKIPALANAELIMKDKVLARKHIPVAQWGSLSFIPAELLTKEGIEVWFDIQTGQLLKMKSK